jgi:hypothetical protein
MRRPIISRVSLTSLILLFSVAASGRADYTTGELHDINGHGLYGGILSPGAGVTINLGNGSSPSVAYYPGVVNWTVATPPAGKPNASWVPPVGGSFTTFCIELSQDINPGKVYTYQLTALAYAPSPGTAPAQANPPHAGMGTIKANAIEELWGQDYSSIATNSTNAAAFQLAIWKIEYDWGTADFDSFGAGNFQATGNSAVLAQAKAWLDAPEQSQRRDCRQPDRPDRSQPSGPGDGDSGRRPTSFGRSGSAQRHPGGHRRSQHALVRPQAPGDGLRAEITPS